VLPQHITCTTADAKHVEHPQVCAPRAVQYMFRRHLDTTPMAYLRRIRLDRAHRDLLAADPSHDTVSAIATRWGFAHTGRFSQVYRAEFGESPSVTLHG
jgi:transcriptional regulator GlxA family with amidase domain